MNEKRTAEGGGGDRVIQKITEWKMMNLGRPANNSRKIASSIGQNTCRPACVFCCLPDVGAGRISFKLP